ncbi:MAG: carbamoyltransferase HypF [Phycisphaeraceae bacterium]|nr:carbamoyltransferase HypF [Phycisphaeraceae bacterium]
MDPVVISCERSERWQWIVRGQVQGVGLRPLVFRLARALSLQGFIRNDLSGARIEAQGSVEQLERFSRALEDQRPPLARFDAVHVRTVPMRHDEDGFRIDASRADGPDDLVTAQVAVDTALCHDCLQELFDPHDRRHRYGLITCTNCGPRFSILRAVPYDRPNTTMAAFTMCPSCREEYTRPSDRRFHAQPIACHACGPAVEFVDARGARMKGDPIVQAARALEDQRIVAIKGLGGFHLAVRADRQDAVARLRRLKNREAKPFALMVRSMAAAERLVTLSAAARRLMRSPACPIVLAPRDAEAAIADTVAPGNHRLGVMLPYTPIHHLLFDELDRSIDALVMTSANSSDEPLVIDNHEARVRLASVCDFMLWHSRPIHRCVDDSVVLDAGEYLPPQPVRRSRGYAPGSIKLPTASRSVGLCVGGDLKNTVAIVRGDQAILSQHLGDLRHALAYESFTRTIADLCDLFAARPQWIAHDLHPGYLSTRHAQRLACEAGIPLIPVQHHQAHAAAVLAEHGFTGRALVIVCDGAGYGADGAFWGGELLLAQPPYFKRLAHLARLRLAGGDAAARDTRRCAMALLHQSLGDDFDRHPAAIRLIPRADERRMLTTMIRRNVNCALSSAAGRVFDGVAALLGVCERNDFEAQAAMALESMAEPVVDGLEPRPMFRLRRDNTPAVIDLSPLVRAILDDPAGRRSPAQWSAIFHDQLAAAWFESVLHFSEQLGVPTVALSGGVFNNQRLTRSVTALCQRHGLTVLRHQRVPAGDGGLALGQAAIAAAAESLDHREIRDFLCV